MKPSLRRCCGIVVVVGALAAGGCGGDADSDGGPSDPPSILTGTEAHYAEASEVGNSSKASSEVTGYTLDTDGLRLTGSFEASDTTSDHFRFNTGPFTHVDVQMLGIMSTITLDCYADDGYSTLMGSGRFVNAWLSGTSRDYVLGVIGGTPGGSYVIEMKGR